MPSGSSKVPTATEQPIVLIGFMGSGKSTVGRLLSRELERQAVDLDTLIEQSAGRRIAEIFAHEGEDAFRRWETDALRLALNSPGILACGGGIVARLENRDLLAAAARQGAKIVYLRATPATLAQRIRRQPGKRPLIDGNGILDLEQTRTRVRDLLAPRAPHYEALATVIIDTDDRALDDVVQQLVTVCGTPTAP